MPNEHTIAENLQRLVDAKDDIADAIVAKGGTVAQGDGLEEFPTAINGISTGVDTSSDTVTAMYLGTGKTAHNAQGQQITGTFPLNTYTVPNGTTELRRKMIPSMLNPNESQYGYGRPEYDYVFLPNTLTSLVYISSTPAAGAFQGFSSLREIDLTYVTTLGQNSFYGCERLKKITWKNANITTISKQAFQGCSSLGPSLELPEALQTIEQYAFQVCTSLESVVIHKNIQSISGVFPGCDRLQYIYIDKPQGSILGAPWSAPNATVIWTG